MSNSQNIGRIYSGNKILERTYNSGNRISKLENGTFTPLSISGLVLWLDAADTSTVILNGQNNVSQLLDKSGNNRHLSQSTAIRQPSYMFSSAGNLAFLRNDDGTKYLQRESDGSVLVEDLSYFGTTTHTILLAWNPQEKTYGNYIFWATRNGFPRLQLTGPFGSSNTGSYYIDSPNANTGRFSPLPTHPLFNTDPHLVTFRRNSSQYDAWANTTQLTSGTRTTDPFVTSGTVALFRGTSLDGTGVDGGDIYSKGDFYEIMCYDRALSDEEVSMAQKYICQKWRIPI